MKVTNTSKKDPINPLYLKKVDPNGNTMPDSVNTQGIHTIPDWIQWSLK